MAPAFVSFLLLQLPLLSFACSSIDCGPGYCVQGHDGMPKCICMFGHEGDRCEKPIVRRSSEVSPCIDSPCKNGGTCISLLNGGEGSGGAVVGESGFPLGESELDCGMGGTCYTCTCTPGFTGPNCLTELSSCPAIITAGVVWESTSAGVSIIKPCSSVDSSLRGTMIVRRCSLNGEWEQPDYTGCTLENESPPFILFWLSAEGEEIEQYLSQLESRLNQLLMSTSNLAQEVTQTQRLSIYDSDFTIDLRVLFTYKIIFPSDANIIDISTSFNGLLPSRIVINDRMSVSLETQGYMGFYPSERCRCLELVDILLRPLCIVVSGNDHTSACSCTATIQERCECQGPFYVGDGIECVVDTDGDGFPNSPLSSCSQASTETYCLKDICPETYYLENTAFPCETDNLTRFDGCRGGQDVWGFTWPNAEDEDTVIVTCPDGQGSAVRTCVNGEWQMAQVLECDSSGFVNTLTEAETVFNDDSKDLSARLNETAVIMANLLQLIQPREGLSHLPGDLNTTNAITSGVLALLEMTLDPDSNVTTFPTQSVFPVFNTALHPNNAQGWMTLQDNKGGASKLLDSMERYGLYLSLVAPDTESRTISQDENFVLGVIRYSTASNMSSVTFPESLDELANTSFSDGITAQISIPSSLLMDRKTEGAKTAPVAGSIARGMETVLLPTNLGETWSVASQVISAQVAQRSVKSSIPIKVTFSFDSVVNASEFRCGYWNFSDQVDSGTWEFDGVEVASMVSTNGTTVITCLSMHLTSFAVLVNAADGTSDLSSAELKALMVVSYIGCAISLACLLIAIIYYITIWRELMVRVHYFIHLNLAISLFLAYFVFVLGIQLARENEGACIFVAALLQYLFLSTFCWMMCEGIMLYLMLIVVFSSLSKKWWFFMIIGWVPALVPVIIGVGARHMEYGVENDSGELEYCWLSTDKGVIWAFIAPMLVIILINTVFLVIALLKVAQTKRRQSFKKKGATKASANFELFKTLFRATVVLLPILGLTWVFGLFAVNQNTSWLAWLFTIFNTSQGCFILVVHVLLSDKFWKNVRVKRLRRYVSSTVRSSQFGSTVYSTIRKSSVKDQSTLKLTKYTTTGTESTGPALGDVMLESSVIANEHCSGDQMVKIEVSTEKVLESTEQN